MQKWHEYRNFRKYGNADGSFTYIITVGGEDIEVSKEIYTAYTQGAYKMEYMECSLKRDRTKKDARGISVRDSKGQIVRLPELEASLDKLMDEDWDFKSPGLSPEDEVVSHMFSENDELRRCLLLLTESEWALIQTLFYEGMTETEYAGILGIKQPSINERKHRILKKIKSFLTDAL